MTRRRRQHEEPLPGIPLPPKRPRRRNEETRTVEAIIAAVNALSFAHVMRNNVGAYKNARDRLVTYGLGDGSPDLVGWVIVSASMPGDAAPRSFARFFALEVKAANGRVSDDQDAWLRHAHVYGAFACVVRSVSEALAAVARAREGQYE